MQYPHAVSGHIDPQLSWQPGDRFAHAMGPEATSRHVYRIVLWSPNRSRLRDLTSRQTGQAQQRRLCLVSRRHDRDMSDQRNWQGVNARPPWGPGSVQAQVFQQLRQSGRYGPAYLVPILLASGMVSTLGAVRQESNARHGRAPRYHVYHFGSECTSPACTVLC